MNLMLTWISARLALAKTAEDVFGELKGEHDEQAAALKAVYHQMARVSHPDAYLNAEEKACAQAAFGSLAEWFEQAQSKIKRGEYGHKAGRADAAETRLQTAKHAYRVSGRFSEGPIYNSYPCQFDEGGQRVNCLLNIVREPQDNGLAENEAHVLRRLARAESAQKFAAYFPGLVDTFIYAESGVERFASVVSNREGWFSLSDVRRGYPAGIDPKDMAWMWRRLLAALGFAHSNGIIHGAVVPGNVFIQPEEHGVLLANWFYAVGQDEMLNTLPAGYDDWYPVEVKNHEGILPATDIDLAAKCMLYLLGGDPAARTFPSALPKALQSFLRGCTLPGKRQRPQDAWALKEEFDDLLQRLYGERKFHPFQIKLNPIH